MSTDKKLLADYDRLVAQRRESFQERSLDLTGDARRKKLEVGAAAARAGESFPRVLDRRQIELEIDCISLALDEIVSELGGAGITERPQTSEELMQLIQLAHDHAKLSKETIDRETSARRNYDRALDIYQTLRADLIMEQGLEPAAASDAAKASMSDADLKALWPPGSPGTLQLRARQLGDTLTAEEVTA